MAEKPLGNNILPADLPTDWVNSQTITADGEEIGLDPQYGYNYLNTQINNAQGSINSINDAFDELVTVDDLESHEEDENVHVSSADRTKWNAAKDQTYIDGQDSTTLASAKDYTDSQISSITGADESVISHVNNTLIHVSSADKAKWNTTPQIFHWNLGDNVDIGTSHLSGVLDSTTSTSWTDVGTSNQPPSFSVPFEANIVAFISLDCEAFGTTAGNDNNGNCVKVTYNRGSGTSTVKYRSLKVAGLDWFSGAKYDQQVRGTIALTEVFENQPANTSISISLAHRRIASDWGASSHMGGRSVTYIAYPA